MVEATNQSQGESKELHDEEEQPAGSHQESNAEEEEDEEEEDDFLNNHDLIGVQGIIRAQKNEIDKKKVRSANTFSN